MINIILCEGIDDATFIGYYLHKVSNEPKWKYDTKAKFTEFYTLPKTKRSIPQIYTRSKNLDDRVAIWPVGGKDSFKKVIDNIMYLNNNFPDNCIDNIFIVSDRDEDDIKETLDRIRQYFIQNYCKLECLNNNKVNKSFFNVDDEEYEFNIIPIIIPFEESGSLETLLLNQISCRSEEDKIVVNKAKEYVNDIILNENITNYLNKDRLKIKSIFSSTVAIINPDHSTREMDKLLMSFDWQNEYEIKNHFWIIEELLK